MIITGITFAITIFTLFDLFRVIHRNDVFTNRSLSIFAYELFAISFTVITIYTSSMVTNEVRMWCRTHVWCHYAKISLFSINKQQ